MNKRVCCQCGGEGHLVNLYGYDFCERCRSKLGLHTDQTIQKNAEKYGGGRAYENEVLGRLQAMDKDYATKRVKLLHILARLGELA